MARPSDPDIRGALGRRRRSLLSLDGMLARVASARACPGRRGVPFYLRVGDQFDDTRGLAPAFAALTPRCVVFRVRPSAVDLTAG